MRFMSAVCYRCDSRNLTTISIERNTVFLEIYSTNKNTIKIIQKHFTLDFVYDIVQNWLLPKPLKRRRSNRINDHTKKE